MSELDELYQATIVDHDRAPRHHGALADASHHATIDNPLCGDVVTVHARIAGGVVHDVAFEARGCALCRAAASIMTTRVLGQPVDAARRLAAAFERFVNAPPGTAADAAAPDVALGELGAFAGVQRFRSRRACALLAFRALGSVLDATAGDATAG